MKLINYRLEKTDKDIKVRVSAYFRTEVQYEFVTFEWKNNLILIRINKMGLSTFVLELFDEGETYRLTEKERNISFFHRLFVASVEDTIDKILIKEFGAKRIN